MLTDFFTNPELLTDYIVPWGTRILIALLIWFVGKRIAIRITRIAKRLMEKTRIDPMLVEFLGNILFTLLLIAVIIAALDHLGIQTTSLLAIFGAAGLAVGLALKDSLGNFASGVMLILFRPFNVGDSIEAGGASGVVEEVRIFSTHIRTADNRAIIVPNGSIYGGTIINNSAKPTRRIDLTFKLRLGADLAKAKQLLAAAMAADARVLKEPTAEIGISNLTDTSVDLFAQPWVKTADYGAVRSDLLERIKNDFGASGISAN